MQIKTPDYSCSNRPSSNRGFTLQELMITIGIVGILTGMAVPSFSTMIKNNRLTAQANELITAINLLRSEAAKRNLTVTMCKSSNGTSCTTSGTWSQGWLIFTDLNKNAVYDSTVETLIRVHEAVQGNLTLTGNTNVSSSISYTALGGIKNKGSITVCDDRRGQAVGKKIALNPVGRPRVVTAITC